MSKQSIYLDDHFEEKVRAIAQREGRSISDVIRKRVELSFQYERKELSLKKLENQMNAMYAIIEILADEISYVNGATKESTKSIDKIRMAGFENAEKINKIVDLVKKSFVNNNKLIERNYL